ncbi:unnamed protein product [Cuscuta campestris]|uniref:DUF1985 domain-containing protein n=1 Tax=Cuscuta campestris TaxID=132261 RepID=A0A484L6G8_9ASTE|nr:unnamed protein product [Cuscuta campestris]
MALMVPTKDHFPVQYSVCGELEDAVAIVRSKLSVENMVNFRKLPFGHFMDVRKLQFSGQLIHILMLHLVREQPEDEMWFMINEDAVAIVRSKLSVENMVNFRKLPFGHFMDVRKLQFSGQLIHILMLHLVREQPEDEMWFMINGTLKKFTFEDFCRITSLPTSKSYPNFSNVKSSSETIHKKYLGGGTVKCTFAHLRNMFMTAEEDVPGSDLHKLASLYFVEHVLLAKDRGDDGWPTGEISRKEK